MDIRSLLVLVADPRQEHQPALDRAIALGSDLGASIHIRHVAYNSALAGGKFKRDHDRQGLIRTLIQSRLQKLSELAEAVKQDGIECTFSAEWDYPLHESIARTASGEFDLVICDTFGRLGSSLPPRVLSHTDWQIVANCPLPCLLVRLSGGGPYRQIIAAVDPTHHGGSVSSLDGEIIEAAKTMSQTFGAALAIVHAHQPISKSIGFPAEVGLSLPETSAVDVEVVLKQLVQTHHLDPGIIDVKEGAPANSILQAIRQRAADLLVMGTVARGRLHDWVMGSTAERVIADLDCDVLALKPEGFRAKIGPPDKYSMLLSG